MLTALSFSGVAYSQSQELTVTTDKGSYNAGDTIVVSGTIQQGQELTTVILQIVGPNNKVLSTYVPKPDGEGVYSVEVATDSWETSGTYTVLVINGDGDRQATFEFVGLDSKPPTENLLVAFSDGGSQNVDAKMTNGVITGISAFEESATLIFSVATGSEDGELTVTLARSMIDSKYEPDDAGVEHENNFLVMVDGEYTDYGEKDSTATNRTLVIPIPAGTQEVLIGGSSMTPEFPLAVLGAVAATAILLTIGRARIFSR
jgi:hypothetical protein